jgi:hypothetical protein
MLNKVVVAPIDRRSIVMNSTMFKAKKDRYESTIECIR